jgi:hypothetical protein
MTQPPLEDLEYKRGSLKVTLDRLISLDESVHDLLPDKEYEVDIHTLVRNILRQKGLCRRLVGALTTVCFHYSIKY